MGGLQTCTDSALNTCFLYFLQACLLRSPDILRLAGRRFDGRGGAGVHSTIPFCVGVMCVHVLIYDVHIRSTECIGR